MMKIIETKQPKVHANRSPAAPRPPVRTTPAMAPERPPPIARFAAFWKIAEEVIRVMKAPRPAYHTPAATSEKKQSRGQPTLYGALAT